MLLVCYSLLNILINISINNSEKNVGYKDISEVAKKAAEVAQKREQ